MAILRVVIRCDENLPYPSMTGYHRLSLYVYVAGQNVLRGRFYVNVQAMQSVYSVPPILDLPVSS